jgi:YHS domain-containing protein
MPRGRAAEERKMSADTTKVKDPVCGMMIDPAKAAAMRVYEGTTYYFCAQGCARAFDAEPKGYAQAKKA